MQTLPLQKPIPLRNAFAVRQQVRFFSNATNDWEPFSGTDLRARLSRYASGYDFAGAPSTICGPYTMTQTAEAGWYYALISGDDVDTYLTDLLGETIYLVVEGAYGSSYYDLTVSQPLLVVSPRFAIPS